MTTCGQKSSDTGSNFQPYCHLHVHIGVHIRECIRGATWVGNSSGVHQRYHMGQAGHAGWWYKLRMVLEVLSGLGRTWAMHKLRKIHESQWSVISR